MKKILALAAVAALTAGVSAFAANPFSDVTPDDWAFQAISDLSDQGVVEGYPDGTFKGERNITRYEAAQIIARLLAKEDQLNAEQRATLDKLAGEYSDELANLGVRVGNLEKKVGNIYWSGNARMRYVESSYKANGDAKGDWDGRMKITAHAVVNDDTYVEGRLRNDFGFKSPKNNENTRMEVIEVHHDFGDKVGVTLGRQDIFLGQTGLQYDDEFDGAVATAKFNPALNLDLGYGYLYAGPSGNIGGTLGKVKDKDDSELFLARLYGDAGRISYDVEYLDGKNDLDARLIGGGLTAHLGGNFKAFGDYYKNTEYKGDPSTWIAGLGYDTLNLSKPGSWDLNAQYIHGEKGAFVGSSTFDLATPLYLFDESSDNIKNYGAVDTAKFWLLSGDVVLQKNVRLHAEYAFDVKTDGGNNTDFDDLFAVSLNYVF